MQLWTKLTATALFAATAISVTAQTSPPQASASAPSADLQARFVKARDAYQAKDYATAAPLLIELCEVDEYAQTCSFAGRLVANGEGTAQDLKKSIDLFGIGCAGGFADSCRYAAAVYEQSAPPLRNDVRAAAFLKDACDLGDLEACAQMGDRHKTGIGVVIDADRAFQYSTKACEGQIAKACTDLGWLYEPFNTHREKGPRADPAKAVEYYRMACDMKDGRACALLGDRYDFGNDVEQDTEMALKLYHLALSYEPEQWVINSVQGRIRALEKAKADGANTQ